MAIHIQGVLRVYFKPDATQEQKSEVMHAIRSDNYDPKESKHSNGKFLDAIVNQDVFGMNAVVALVDSFADLPGVHSTYLIQQDDMYGNYSAHASTGVSPQHEAFVVRSYLLEVMSNISSAADYSAAIPVEPGKPLIV